MIFKRLSFTLMIGIVAFCNSSFSQTPLSRITQTDTLANDSASFYLHADITQFLKNNEYFSPIVEGYTLFGTNLKAGGYFMPSSKAKIYFGLNAIKYFGDTKINTIAPDINITYNFNNHIKVVMGSLYHQPQNNLIPLFTDHETLLTEPAKEGLAFAFRNNRLQWDIWVAWLQYLHPYEHSQEKIYLGNTFEYKIIKNERFEVCVPFQFTAYHIGGQINDVWMPLTMILNNAVGLSTKLKLEKGNVTVRYFYVGYTDLTTNSNNIYQNGDGHFIDASLQTKHFQTSLSYWRGFQFFSPYGEAMYSSISSRIPIDNPPSNQRKRELITAHFYYNTDLTKGLTLLTGLQLFYDTHNAICDYSYSFMLRYCGDLLVKNHSRAFHHR